MPNTSENNNTPVEEAIVTDKSVTSNEDSKNGASNKKKRPKKVTAKKKSRTTYEGSYNPNTGIISQHEVLIDDGGAFKRTNFSQNVDIPKEYQHVINQAMKLHVTLCNKGATTSQIEAAIAKLLTQCERSREMLLKSSNSKTENDPE